MDYLPHPQDSISGIDVPLVTTIQYDFEGYERFPERHGFTKSNGHLNTDQPPDKVALLLQSWLYFGLLAEFFGTPIDIHIFAHEDTPGTPSSVTAASVRDLIKERISPNMYNASGKCFVRGVNRDCLTVAKNVLDEYQSFEGLASPVPEIVLSIQLLIQALQISFCSEIAGFESRLLREHMSALGWCPRQTEQLFHQHHLIVVYYLAMLRRRNPHRLSHIRCTRDRCIAYNVNERRYQSRHIREDCKCSFISVSTEAIKSIIGKGGIPLISIERETNGITLLKVEDARARSKYIAISHVWADGRGNPYANALLDCQVQELEDRFRHQPGITVLGSQSRSSQLFWIDTLCIPVGDDPEVKDLRSRAINQMALIYSRAQRVLVLESELSLTHLGTSRSAEVFGYICCCAWMQRCWTLQEGALARNCFFQCADGALNPLDEDPYEFQLKHEIWWRMAWNLRSQTLWQFLGSIYRELSWSLISSFFIGDKTRRHPIDEFVLEALQTECRSALKKPEAHSNNSRIFADAQPRTSASQFIFLWNALSQRETTKSDDIQIIFANMLSLNGYQLLKLSPSLRFKAILFTMKAIPSSLLFISSPKLDAGADVGDRWIPTTLSNEKLDEGLSLMHIENDGVHLDSRNLTMCLFERCSDHRYRSLAIQSPNMRLLAYFDRDNGTRLGADFPITTAIIYPQKFHQKSPLKGFIGACFAVLDAYALGSRPNMRRIEAIYDCSVKLAWDVEGDAGSELNKSKGPSGTQERDISDEVISDAEFLHEAESSDNESGWELKMSHDPSNVPKLKSLFISETESSATLFYSMLFVISPLIFAMPVVRIKIAVGLGWSTLSSVGRASLLLWIPEIYARLCVFFPMSPILFIIDRANSSSGFQGLDIAYLVLTFTLFQVFPLAGLLIFRIESSARFNLYLKSFREDWTEGNIGLFMRVHLSYQKLVLRFFDSVGSWVFALRVYLDNIQTGGTRRHGTV